MKKSPAEFAIDLCITKICPVCVLRGAGYLNLCEIYSTNIQSKLCFQHNRVAVTCLDKRNPSETSSLIQKVGRRLKLKVKVEKRMRRRRRKQFKRFDSFNGF